MLRLVLGLLVLLTACGGETEPRAAPTPTSTTVAAEPTSEPPTVEGAPHSVPIPPKEYGFELVSPQLRKTVFQFDAPQPPSKMKAKRDVRAIDDYYLSKMKELDWELTDYTPPQDIEFPPPVLRGTEFWYGSCGDWVRENKRAIVAVYALPARLARRDHPVLRIEINFSLSTHCPEGSS